MPLPALYEQSLTLYGIVNLGTKAVATTDLIPSLTEYAASSSLTLYGIVNMVTKTAATTDLIPSLTEYATSSSHTLYGIVNIGTKTVATTDLIPSLYKKCDPFITMGNPSIKEEGL